MIMKKLLFAMILPLAAVLCCSCEDEREIDVTPKVYMPQSTWGLTYVVNGTKGKDNKNYEIDKANNKVNIFLGVYQSGAEALGGFSVDISTGGVPVDGTTLLPGSAYDLPRSIAVAEGPAGELFLARSRPAFPAEKPEYGLFAAGQHLEPQPVAVQRQVYDHEGAYQNLGTPCEGEPLNCSGYEKRKISLDPCGFVGMLCECGLRR